MSACVRVCVCKYSEAFHIKSNQSTLQIRLKLIM